MFPKIRGTFWGSPKLWGYVTPIVGNQMEKKMENEMETVIIKGYIAKKFWTSLITTSSTYRVRRTENAK